VLNDAIQFGSFNMLSVNFYWTAICKWVCIQWLYTNL
jgi:hypothetical protein